MKIREESEDHRSERRKEQRKKNEGNMKIEE